MLLGLAWPARKVGVVRQQGEEESVAIFWFRRGVLAAERYFLRVLLMLSWFAAVALLLAHVADGCMSGVCIFPGRV